MVVEDALNVLGSEPAVDVMLSDLRMPGTDGLGLLRRVNAQHPQTVCILLTAYGSVEVAVEAMKQGAYDFLTKPTVSIERTSGEAHLRHHVSADGFYRGRKVIETATEQE